MMSCLDPHIKIQMMLDSIKQIRRRLKDDSIRPSLRAQLMAELKVLKHDLKQLCLDINKVISN